ncbi:MAG TPA: calcium-binding protein, partial [Burkholderiaceae bacterium]|nr:calcium-binding protein [Burkholderiaceae bacterium]
MTITLNDTEIATLKDKETKASTGELGYWQIYQWLADLLQTKGVPDSHATMLWLRGATEANAGRGAMAALIRAYTETQYQLRYGTALPGGLMQVASNAVAQNLIDDLLGRNAPLWPAGQVPDIARIAEADAVAVGTQLFGIAGDTSAPPTNSAWSGTLLFTMLGSDQTGRLIGAGAAGALDTLNDVRDILFAAVAYAKALPIANAAYWSGSAAQIATDTQIMGSTMINYFNSGHTFDDIWNTVINGATSGVVGDAFKQIAHIGPARFLDMLMGAMQGKTLIGNTTEANFATNAHAFFSALAPAELQSLQTQILPIDAPSLMTLAQTDVNARAALAALSGVSVQVAPDVAQRFSLYNPATGEGRITDRWIEDRARAQAAFMLYWARGETDGILSVANLVVDLPFAQFGDTHIVVEGGTPERTQQLTIDGLDVGLIPAALRYFGSDQNDARSGSAADDRLYGQDGNDTLSGADGNDYLEGGTGADVLEGGAGDDVLLGGEGADMLIGGAGFDTLMGGAGEDTYALSASDHGADVIIDHDNAGHLSVDGNRIGGFTYVGAGLFRSTGGHYQLAVLGDVAHLSRAADGKAIAQVRGASATQVLSYRLPEAPAPVPVSFAGNAQGNLINIYYKQFVDINGPVSTIDQTVYPPVVYGSVSAEGQADNDLLIGGTHTHTELSGGEGNDWIYAFQTTDALSDSVQYLSGGEDSDFLFGQKNTNIIDGGNGNDYIQTRTTGASSRLYLAVPNIQGGWHYADQNSVDQLLSILLGNGIALTPTQVDGQSAFFLQGEQSAGFFAHIAQSASGPVQTNIVATTYTDIFRYDIPLYSPRGTQDDAPDALAGLSTRMLANDLRRVVRF